MKRDKNLHPLSWEHHHALTAVVLTRRAIKDKASPERLRQIAHEFELFHKEAMLPHFRHEEEWLLPRYLRHVSVDDPDVIRLLTEHVSLHRMVYDVIAAAQHDTDLEGPLTALTDRLEAHVRFEERELFPKIESVLTIDEMQSVGESLWEQPPDSVVIPGGDGCRVKTSPDNAQLPDA